MNRGFLNSLRVLDLTDEKGMLCGRILADLGAEVIKVEEPRGDLSRNIGPFYDDSPDPEKSLFWFSLNANKKGVTLNLHNLEGRHILRKLVANADVVIESFPPGYLEKLDLDFVSLRKINQKIIMTSISDFGQSGPYKDFKGCDIVVTALSGFLFVCGDEDRPPVRISYPQAYLHAGGHAAVATLIGYLQQQKTNMGQHIDVSAQEGVLMCAAGIHQYFEVSGVIPNRAGPCQQLSPHIYRQMYWRCKDGFVCFGIYGGMFGLPFNKAMTEWLDEEGIECEFMKKRDWSKFDMSTVTAEEIDEMKGPLETLFIKYNRSELYCEARKRRLIFSPVSTAKDPTEDVQLSARDFWQAVEHAEFGKNILYPGAFAQSSEVALGNILRAPLIGEHNEEIYMKELKIDKDGLCILKVQGVI